MGCLEVIPAGIQCSRPFSPKIRRGAPSTEFRPEALKVGQSQRL